MENVKALLGKGMDIVLKDLSACGYDAQWDVLPAAAFGAPHLRERVIIVGYPRGHRGGEHPPVFTQGRDLADFTQSYGPDPWPGIGASRQRAEAAFSLYREPKVCRISDGGADWVDRLKCLGNGITPVVLRYVGERIKEIENITTG